MKLVLKIIFFPFIIIWKVLCFIGKNSDKLKGTASALKSVEKSLNIKM
jgi:hypothetical protein